MKNPTLSLDEPWASLLAAGIKTIETRSWSTRHRGVTFIHATKKPFGFNSDRAELLRGNLTLHQYRQLSRHLWVQKNGKRLAAERPLESVDPELWRNYLPGHVVAVAKLVDCLPIVDEGHVLHNGIEGERVVTVTFEDLESVVRTWTYGTIKSQDWDGAVEHDLGLWSSGLGESPSWGDYTPGRFAWVFESIRPFEVAKPAVGHQRIWEWKDGPFR